MDEKTDKKRNSPISYRPPAGKEDEFDARVARSGLSQNGYITECIFGEDAPRASRQPSGNAKLIAHVLSLLVRINGRLEEFAARAGDPDAVLSLFRELRSDFSVIRTLCLKAFGKKS